MIRLVLIRPGMTDFDAQGRIQGTLDIPLNDEGRIQAAAAADQLAGKRLTAIYSAPCAASVETANIVAAKLQLKAKQLDKLHNLDQGLWQGMLVEEVRRKQPKVYRHWQEHPESVCPPGGEMLEDALERLEEIFEKLLRKHRAETIGVVIPEPLATLLEKRLTCVEPCELWKPHKGCGPHTLLEVPDNVWPKALAAPVSTISETNGAG